MSSFMQSLGFKTSSMSTAERADLARLETTVKTGLSQALAVGQALAEIFDLQLIRESHMSFEDYAKDIWKLSKSRAYQLIAAASVAENVHPGGDRLTEKAARELNKLPADQQKAAWDEAAELVEEGAVVPASVVAAAVAKRSKKKARRGTPKPVRIRVPGATVIVALNKSGSDISQALRDALEKIGQQAKAA